MKLTQEIGTVLLLGNRDIGGSCGNSGHIVIPIGEVRLGKDPGDRTTHQRTTSHCSIVHVGAHDYAATVHGLRRECVGEGE